MRNPTIRQNKASKRYRNKEKVPYKQSQPAQVLQHTVHYEEIYSCCSMSSTILSATGQASSMSCSNFWSEQLAGKPLASGCKSKPPYQDLRRPKAVATYDLVVSVTYAMNFWGTTCRRYNKVFSPSASPVTGSTISTTSLAASLKS